MIGLEILDNKLPQNVQGIRRSHKLHRENHENLGSGIDSRRKKLIWSEIQRGIFQEDELSSLLFVLAMMLLNHILRKCTGGYKLSKILGKDKSPNVHGWHHTVYQKHKRTGNSKTHCQKIESWRRNGIKRKKMPHTSNEKPQTTPYGRNGTIKSRKNLNAGRKGNRKILWDTGSWYHQKKRWNKD